MSLTDTAFQPPIIAHRGASAVAPENTLAAFRQAKTLGIQWIEFDVMLAACGKAIVFHDETLERTTTGVGRVTDYPYDEYLQALNAGAWFHPNFAGEKIPTFRSVVELACELQLNMNIEIKPMPGQEEKIVKTVLNILHQFSTDRLPQFFISSFSHLVLQYVRELSRTISLGFLMDEWHADWQQKSDDLQCRLIDVNYHVLTPERVQEIKRADKYLLAYTVNEPQLFNTLREWGVDAVFSDCPAAMLCVI